MKRVAIIGANSYIARNLIAFLSETGEDCELALYDYAPEHVDGRGNYKSIRVTEQNGFDDVDFGCDLIYDFVGKTGTFAGFLDFEPYLNVNELGLLNLLRAYVNLLLVQERCAYLGVFALWRNIMNLVWYG